MDFRLFLLRHAELFHALGDWTIRVLFSRSIWGSPSMFMSAADDQLARPLRTSEVEELRWLFQQRRSATSEGPAVDPPRLAATSRAFRGPRFQALYRRWLDAGDSALWLAQSTAFRDALERGEARIESLELPYSYMNLSRMIGTALHSRRGEHIGDEPPGGRHPLRFDYLRESDCAPVPCHTSIRCCQILFPVRFVASLRLSGGGVFSRRR